MRTLTPEQLGHRAAAVGEPITSCSLDGAAQALWEGAYRRADAFRQNRLDPNGHQPAVPHLCARDVTKVCNCCDACRTECQAEGVRTEVPKQISAERLMWLLERAVVALEIGAHARSNASSVTSGEPCPTCRSLIQYTTSPRGAPETTRGCRVCGRPCP